MKIPFLMNRDKMTVAQHTEGRKSQLITEVLPVGTFFVERCNQLDVIFLHWLFQKPFEHKELYLSESTSPNF